MCPCFLLYDCLLLFCTLSLPRCRNNASYCEQNCWCLSRRGTRRWFRKKLLSQTNWRQRTRYPWSSSWRHVFTADQIRNIIGLDVSKLARQRLRAASLEIQNAAPKPLLSADAKAKAHDFACAYVPWTTDDWQSVVFTDECTVCTKWSQKQKVYRPVLMRFVFP